MNEIKWLRPYEYIRENNLHKKLVEKIPNKNHIKIRRCIRESLQISLENSPHVKPKSKITNSSNDLFAFLDENYETYRMKLLNKEFAKYYKTDLSINLVNTTERDLREDEIIKRKEELELNQKINNLKDKKIKIPEQAIEYIPIPQKIKQICPSNIDMSDKYPKFSKWVASILQIILDLNIRDANDDQQTIFNKIYPQSDKIPIYNPCGRYWVKLFHMGTYRKIEVDDRMPCGRYEEFLLPRCDKLEELWPAILTKALIKLFSYKFNNINYSIEEIGDSAIIYALTGYVGEKMQLSSFMKDKTEEKEQNDLSEIKKMMKFVTTDERYFSGHKIMIAFKSNHENKSENKVKLNQEILNKPLISNKRNSIMLIEPNHDVIRKIQSRKLTVAKSKKGDYNAKNSTSKGSLDNDKVNKKLENSKFNPDKTQEISNIRKKSIVHKYNNRSFTGNNLFDSESTVKNSLFNAPDNTFRNSSLD